jgi:hypothetical protein
VERLVGVGGEEFDEFHAGALAGWDGGGELQAVWGGADAEFFGETTTSRSGARASSLFCMSRGTMSLSRRPRLFRKAAKRAGCRTHSEGTRASMRPLKWLRGMIMPVLLCIPDARLRQIMYRWRRFSTSCDPSLLLRLI